ncbi:MAG: CRISPR-associated protein Cas5 [Thermosphaera sp.]
MTNIRGFYASATLSWGFIVRHKGVTAAQPAYPVTPPTTVVGAFGYPLARLLELPIHVEKIGKEEKKPKRKKSEEVYTIDWGEGKLVSEPMKPLLEATITASAAVVSPRFSISKSASASRRIIQVGLAVYQEIGKIVSSPYKSGGSYQKAFSYNPMDSEFFTYSIPTLLPAQAVGAVYAPALKVELLWVVDIEKLSRELGVSIEKLDSVAGRAVYSVVRIGSKEGLVALEKAYYFKNPTVLEAKEKVRTRLYVEESCIEKALDPSRVVKITMPNLRYSTVTYHVPALIGSNNLIIPLDEETPPPSFEIKESCKAIALPGLENVVGVFPS